MRLELGEGRRGVVRSGAVGVAAGGGELGDGVERGGVALVAVLDRGGVLGVRVLAGAALARAARAGGALAVGGVRSGRRALGLGALARPAGLRGPLPGRPV